MPTAAEITLWTEQLAQAESALHQLMMGARVVRLSVPGDGHSIEYTPTSAANLKGYVMDLKAKLGQTTGGRAIGFDF